MVTPGVKRDAVVHAQKAFGVSERRACIVIGIARQVARYVSQWPDDVPGYGRWRRSDAGLAIGGWAICWRVRDCGRTTKSCCGFTVRRG